MNDMAQVARMAGWKYQLFRSVKYATYLALSFNVYLFFEQELTASDVSQLDALTVTAMIQLFSATLDTAAWLVLLLLFELETAVLPDDKLVGLNRWIIHGLRLVCGAAIVSAFFGYVGEWQVFFEATSIPAAPCTLIDQGWTLLTGFDEFVPLDAASCGAIGTDALQITALEQVVASPQAFTDARDLAMVDVINAGAWILVVLLLEIEVRQQLQGGLPARLQWLFNGAKALVYATLALAAVYWGFEGDFLDFWDAALWLFAFVFIEMNVFEWQRELDSHH